MDKFACIVNTLDALRESPILVSGGFILFTLFPLLPVLSFEHQFQVIVDCRDEQQQLVLIEKLEKQKFVCRALIKKISVSASGRARSMTVTTQSQPLK